MYGVGGFDFPTSTGSHAVVTGLGFEPVAVIMFGSNFSTVGSLMTSQTGPGLFISVNGLDYSDGTTMRSLCLSPNGNSDANNANYRGYENGPISMQTNAGTAATVDYRANAITFDSDGFTLNVTTAAGSRRPIHYVAFGGTVSDSDLTALVSSVVKQQMTTNTFANSYNPLSALVVSTIANNGFGEGNVDGSAWFSFGTGHYPAYDSGNVNTWQSSTTYAQIQLASSLGRQGFTEQQIWGTGTSDPSVFGISNVISSLGPILVEGFRRHRPDVLGAGLDTMINEGGGGGAWQYALWWNGEGWTGSVPNIEDATSETINHPSNFSEFEAVMFSTINGTAFGGGPGAAILRYGFGVLGPNYQGCVVFGQDGSCYQSVTRAVATCDGSAANTASGTIDATSFTLSQEEGGTVGGITYHAFGRTRVVFIPQIYRRVFR